MNGWGWGIQGILTNVIRNAVSIVVVAALVVMCYVLFLIPPSSRETFVHTQRLSSYPIPSIFSFFLIFSLLCVFSCQMNTGFVVFDGRDRTVCSHR